MRLVITLMIVTIVISIRDIEQGKDNVLKHFRNEINHHLEKVQENLEFTIMENKELQAENENLMNQLTHLKKSSEVLEDSVFNLKNAQYLHICAENSGISKPPLSRNLHFTSILYSSTNMADGGLDIETGVFTCPTPGTYSVTWSMIVTDSHDMGQHWLSLFLRKNRRDIIHSLYWSYFTNPDDGTVGDIGKQTWRKRQAGLTKFMVQVTEI